jgi:hypothetical protein
MGEEGQVMRVLAILFFSASLGTTASGETNEQHKCWLGSMSYSPGATARAADRVMVCSADFTWQQTEAMASGCILEGEFFSVGTIENGPRSGSIKLVCIETGEWQQLSE